MVQPMSYPLLIFFGLAPSIIWLLFYLRKDVHPESNSMILKIFGYGMLIAIPTALIELGIFSQLSYNLNVYQQGFSQILILGLLCVLGVGLPEEIMKYLVVKTKVLSSPEFDEPTDAMLYMIICALGFAALENVLILFPFKGILEIFAASWIRLIGATFLHALCAGTVGYFLAISFFDLKRKFKLTAVGLIIAITLHGLYNFFIMMEGTLKLAGPAVILIGLAIFVSFGFKKVKKMKSVCLFSKK